MEPKRTQGNTLITYTAARSCNHYCRGKTSSITYSKCVFTDSGIQHAKRMRRIILSSEASPAVPHVSSLSHKRDNFRKRVTEHKTRVFIFPTTFVWKISHSRKNARGSIVNVQRSSCKVAATFDRFEWNVNFLHRISQNTHTSNFMTIRPVQAELLHPDGQINIHDKANCRFSQFRERALKRNATHRISVAAA
jgi:hypothetical protein